MSKNCVFLLILTFSGMTFAKEAGRFADWKSRPHKEFTDAENNFKLVMQKILDKYIDQKISKEDLYQAATAGMLDSLNSGEQTWNKLISPSEMNELEIELSGKVIGIGVAIKFDETTGYGHVINIIPSSPSEKSGLKPGDLILNVDGKTFKGKQFRDMVYSIRGQAGQNVDLKILREDKVLNLAIKREQIPWAPVELHSLNDSTALLSIGYFNEDTPKNVEEKLSKIKQDKISKLIVDLRDNEGGGFQQAIKTAELFLSKDTLITSTKNRQGQIEEFRSSKDFLPSTIQIVLLTNKETKSGAELFVAALKENKKIKVIGEPTHGKWSVQTLEKLPNKYAIKFTVSEFRSPLGNVYQEQGILPDIEVSLPKNTDFNQIKGLSKMDKRLALDTPLKAALEILKSN